MPDQDDNTVKAELSVANALSGSLGERLAAYRAWVTRQWPDYEQLIDGFVDRVSAAGAGKEGLKRGDPFPDFALPNQAGHVVKLGDLLAKGPAVVSFNRGHWCGFCHVELNGLSEAAAEITGFGAQLVSIIPEPEAMARRLKSSLSLPFDVLSDMDLGLMTELGLTVCIGEELRSYYLADDLDIGAYQLTDGWFLPIPATFVLAPDATIVARHIDPDFRRRMDVERILEALAEAVRPRQATPERRESSPPPAVS
jgi:peroxiredoxin